MIVRGALARPVTSAMSHPLATVPAEAFAYLAVSRMNRLKVRHLGVTDAAGHVTGALSARDLLRLRAESGVLLGDRIDQAQSVNDLARRLGACRRGRSRSRARRPVGSRGRGRDLARARRHDAARRGARRAAHALRRARAPRPALTRSSCSARRGAVKACSQWTRTTPSCSPRANPRAPRIAGSRRSGRMSPTSCTKPAFPIAPAA